MKLFIGLKVSVNIKMLCHELQKTLPAEARLVHAEDLHLTLLPPWEVEEGDLGLIKEKLENVAHRTHPFEVALETVEFRPDAGVIWIHCQTSPELVQLKEQLDEAFSQKEEREFLPHITLARIKVSGSTSYLKKLNGMKLRVNSVELFESRLNEAVKYRVIESLEL